MQRDDLPKGERVYIRKRPQFDWGALFREWQNGATQGALAARLGVSRRTVIRQFNRINSKR